MDTLDILVKKYSEYNIAYFDGKLPMIPIRWGKIKYATAHVAFDSIGKGRVRRYYGNLHMVFSDKYDRPADTLFPVLLHEMIHVYIVAILDDIEDDHGSVFKKIRAELSAKSGVDIPMTDKVEDFDLKIPIKPLYVILRYYRDTVGYALVTKSVIDTNHDKFNELFRRDDVEVREINSEIWTKKSQGVRIQRVLSYRTGYFILKNPTELQDLLDHSIVLWTNRPAQN